MMLMPASCSRESADERTLRELLRVRRRSLIVFDSSPLLLTTEAIAFASQVGQVLMIVRADVTPQQSVLAALEKLDPEKAINCVLNQTTGADLSESYGYYGDYGDLPPAPAQ